MRVKNRKLAWISLSIILFLNLLTDLVQKSSVFCIDFKVFCRIICFFFRILSLTFGKFEWRVFSGKVRDKTLVEFTNFIYLFSGWYKGLIYQVGFLLCMNALIGFVSIRVAFPEKPPADVFNLFFDFDFIFLFLNFHFWSGFNQHCDSFETLGFAKLEQ